MIAVKALVVGFAFGAAVRACGLPIAFFAGNFIGKLEMTAVGTALTAARRAYMPVRA